MGGLATKQFGAQRVNRDVYFFAKSLIISLLKDMGLPYYIPEERADKADFGDIDCLISCTPQPKKGYF